MSVLCAEKLVLFTVTDDTVAHDVFVRGVKLVVDEPCDPASIFQTVDSMYVCSGSGFLESSHSRVPALSRQCVEWEDLQHEVQRNLI